MVVIKIEISNGCMVENRAVPEWRGSEVIVRVVIIPFILFLMGKKKSKKKEKRRR